MPAAKKKPAKKPTVAKRPHGRPSTYRKEVADEICARLSKGEPLAEICRADHMPAVRTVSGWKEAHPDFSADFARARDEGYDAIAADCLKIANTPLEGIRTETGDDGKTKEVREDMLGHRKLQIETRLKLLAKWDPKRYGDKQQVEHSGDISLVEALNAARARSGI